MNIILISDYKIYNFNINDIYKKENITQVFSQLLKANDLRLASIKN